MSNEPMADDMLPEYRFDYSKARPNRFAVRLNQERLAQECAKLDPCAEQAMAEEGLTAADFAGPSRTDWARVDALSEDEIDTSDIPPLTEDELARSEWRFPAASRFGQGRAVMVEVAIEEDILAWFQAQGQDYPQRMQAALRLYAEAHRVSM